MEINKAVAHKELKFIGGQPKVTKFIDDIKRNSVDILKCVDVPQKGIQTCATIGLNGTNLGLVSNGNDLRVEVVGASDIKTEKFENIVSSVAFEVMNSRKCYPGYVVKNVIDQYISNCDMRHVLLTDPFLWEEAECISIDNITVAWLMIVPISEREYNYACERGIDALEVLFEENDIDIYNIYRKSVV